MVSASDVPNVNTGKEAYMRFTPDTQLLINVGAMNNDGGRQPVYEKLTLADLGFAVDASALPELDNAKVAALHKQDQTGELAVKYINEFSSSMEKALSAQGGPPAGRLFQTCLEYIWKKYDFSPEDRADGFVLQADGVTLQWIDGPSGYWAFLGSAFWG